MSDDLPEFYYFPGSFYSQKALLALTEKQIPVTKKIVNISNFENYEAWFMRINPLGQVPVLVDEGKVISDSTNIVKYCDETYEGPVLMPELGKEKWQRFQEKFEAVRVECLTYGSFVHQDLVTNSYVPSIIRNKMRGKVLSGDRSKRVQTLLEQNPDMSEVYTRKVAGALELEAAMKDRDLVLKELDGVRELLTEVNDTITEAKQEWLCGPEITIADICLAILLQRLKMVGFSKQLWEDGKLPMVDAYYERLLYWKPFRDVCVQGSSKTTLLKYVFSEEAVKIIPALVSCFVLVVALGLGYLVYQRL